LVRAADTVAAGAGKTLMAMTRSVASSLIATTLATDDGTEEVRDATATDSGTLLIGASGILNADTSGRTAIVMIGSGYGIRATLPCVIEMSGCEIATGTAGLFAVNGRERHF
jgi:hypothetical protein